MKFRLSKKYIQETLQKRSVRQIMSLFSINVLGIPLSIVTNIIITRYTGAEIYGDYKFIQGVFNVFVILFALGFSQAGNRILVLSKDKSKNREYYGAVFTVMLATSVLMCLSLIIYGLFDHNMADKGLNGFFISVVPLCVFTLTGKYFEDILPADNRIGLLGKLRILPRVINLLAACVLYFAFFNASIDKLLVVTLIYSLSNAIVYAYIVIKLKPEFTSLKSNIKELYLFNKSYGFNVYVGSLCAVGFASLTDILISYFGTSNVGVGYYSLAVTLSQPLSFVPGTIATTHYKSFSGKDRIPRKLILTTLVLSVSTMLALWLIVPPFVSYLYGVDFLPVIKLNLFVSLGVLLYGLADFFNRFIGANGEGKILRNASFIVGFVSLTSNLLLIPKFAEYGASYAKIAAGFIYLIVIYIFYLKVVKAKLNNKIIR